MKINRRDHAESVSSIIIAIEPVIVNEIIFSRNPKPSGLLGSCGFSPFYGHASPHRALNGRAGRKK